MRTAGRLAAGAVAAGIIALTLSTAPSAGAVAVTAGRTGPAARTLAASQAHAPQAQAAKAQAPKAPAAPAGVRSLYAELAVAATGKDLWSRSSSRERPMGSVTKVMTAYVVLTSKKLDLNRTVTVPASVVAYDDEFDASTAGLRPGEKLSTRQLLYAMLLPSGCDAAYTLAAAYGPGLPQFIAKMNAAAGKLGLTKSHFTDPSGLPDPGEYSTYSTPHDLVNLGRAAMKLKTFAAIVKTRVYRIPDRNGHQAHTWKNLNPLLRSYRGALGIKTGFTSAAGQCLLFEARRGSQTLIGVVLDSSSDSSSVTAASDDATAMLNWGFGR